MGILHPDYLLEQLTAKQMIEWEAFNLLDPIGEIRTDIHAAHLQSLLVNIAIGTHGKKGQSLTSPKDYLVQWYQDPNESERKQSAEQIKDFLMMFAKEHNAKVQKKLDAKNE